ncbi:O-antigen ligase family protein [Jatrophihabitans sp.]|uniref:O-antigen ligase family protein n=1 Tax=Jatrophihabitans sp. TaxID=1932789 RepID=UPI002CB7D310|nr:O-antigen ligase family protein [Jatrophihabitans sp.]
MSRPLVTARELPAWPVYLLFAGFPLWWFLGLGAFAVAVMAIPMFVLLVQRRNIEVPPAFYLWLGFVVWAGAAVLELSTASKLIGFSVRMANYVGCTIVFLYLYNGRNRLDRRVVLRALVLFFAVVVAGGYLGILVPRGSLSTPLQALLPLNIRNNEYVHALVHPAFAEVQRPYGSPRTFYRPSAPFPYTNSWGCNVALLVPLVIAALLSFRRPVWRLAMVGLLAAACLPAFATLNRGMFLAVGLVLSYTAVRLAARGRLVPLVTVLAGAAVGVTVAVASGVLGSLQERLHYSQTNVGRQTIYREAFDGALSSPVFGHGAPQPSGTVDVSIGTQGQVWNVMFSYGFIALAFFLGWFGLVVLQSWRTRGQADLWVHATLFVAFVTFFYYGYDGIQLAVAMSAAALALRSRRGDFAVPAGTAVLPERVPARQPVGTARTS